jgi:sugar phosphate isomerase/epimerase
MKELFASFNVTVMFEPIDFSEFVVGTVGWTNEILNTPELSAIPVVPDIHNMYRNGEGSSQLKNLKNPIGIFHIDDTMPGIVETLHVAKSRMFPGEGVAQADIWIKTVVNMGYEGYYSLELFDDQIYRMDPQAAANLCMEKLTAFENSL